MVFFSFSPIMLKPEQPIGIFDSGVGGLTVASAIKHLLPNERIIYFGDTAHLPYGDKSNETIIKYSTHITDFLLEKNVKVVLIACNTASAVAYHKLFTHLNNSVFLVNVIDPVVQYITSHFSGGKIGVIGTKATIKSGTYEQKIIEKDPQIQVSSMATPLFVPMIEEGFVYDDISNAIIRAYLSDKKLEHIQSLILGCTHYPIIKNQIRKFFDFKVDVVDSGNIVARHLRDLLEKHNLINDRKNPEHVFYVSDYTEYFESIARMFFDEPIHLETKYIWQE